MTPRDKFFSVILNKSHQKFGYFTFSNFTKHRICFRNTISTQAPSLGSLKVFIRHFQAVSASSEAEFWFNDLQWTFMCCHHTQFCSVFFLFPTWCSLKSLLNTLLRSIFSDLDFCCDLHLLRILPLCSNFSDKHLIPPLGLGDGRSWVCLVIRPWTLFEKKSSTNPDLSVKFSTPCHEAEEFVPWIKIFRQKIPFF